PWTGRSSGALAIRGPRTSQASCRQAPPGTRSRRLPVRSNCPHVQTGATRAHQTTMYTACGLARQVASVLKCRTYCTNAVSKPRGRRRAWLERERPPAGMAALSLKQYNETAAPFWSGCSVADGAALCGNRRHGRCAGRSTPNRRVIMDPRDQVFVHMRDVLERQRAAFLSDMNPPLAVRRDRLARMLKMTEVDADEIARAISAGFRTRSVH